MDDVSKRRTRARLRVAAATALLTVGLAASAQAGSGGISSESGDSTAKSTDSTPKRMEKSVATWYGPGFWGNRTACGQKLRKRTIGVAHRKLPCGTKVTVAYRGRVEQARVIDRGPYAHGATWDLTRRLARRIHMRATSTIRTAVHD